MLICAQPVDKFTDVRELQRQLKAQGMELQSEADGNTILVDQHV